MKDFVHELWFFLSVITAVAFLYAYAVRWIQTMLYSKGHRILGLLGVSGVGVCVVVLAFARTYAYVFLPIGCAGLSAWLFYNNWFFTRYPLPIDGLRERPPSGAPDFITHLRLLNYLSGPEDVPKRPGFLATHFKTIGLILGLVFAFGFGFTRVVYYIHEGDRRVAESIRSSQTTTARTVHSVVSQVTRQTQAVVKQAFDTLQQGQVLLAQGIDSNSRQTKALTGVVRQTNVRAGELGRKVGNVEASVERVRRSPLLIVSPIPSPAGSPGVISTERVKALPQLETKPRRRKVSQLEADSLPNYARETPYPEHYYDY